MKYDKRVEGKMGLVDWFNSNKELAKKIWGSWYGYDVLKVNKLDMGKAEDRSKFIEELKKDGLWKK